MKKFLFILSLNLTLILTLTSCQTTFDGYSYSVDDARNKESSYIEYDYIFSVDNEGYFVDFLISGKQLHIMRFDAKEQNNTSLYKIKSKATFLIDEILSRSKSEDAWVKTGNFPFQIEIRITEKDIEAAERFEFIYDNTTCLLQYRINHVNHSK